jgi:tetratricopeptide (TPR) repeat protein
LPDASHSVAWLLAAPDLHVLATSRERLAVAGEQEYPVPTLAVNDAVELFVHRAQQLNPSFESDESVCEIAQRLDGLPLAIELAAVRVKVLRPRQILERLGHSLDLLTGGARDLPARQQTLRATIKWSHDLLSDDEKRCFSLLSVFSGSFDFDAAEHVAEADLNSLQSLLDKGLLHQTREGRFFLLATIREFAAEVFADDTDAPLLHQRHADWYVRRAEEFAAQLEGDLAQRALLLIDAEIGNVRAALAWLAEADPRTGLRLASALWEYWSIRGLLSEAVLWAHACWKGEIPSDVKLDALRLIGGAAMQRSDAPTLRSSSLERLQLARAARSRDHEAGALNSLGVVAQLEGDYAKARDLMEQSLAAAREGGDPRRIASMLGNLGIVERLEGQYKQSQERQEEALAFFRSNGPAARVPEMLCNYAETLVVQGLLDDAAGAVRESLELAAEIDHRGWLPQALVVAAAVAAGRARGREAAALLAAAHEFEAAIGLRVLTPEQGSLYQPTLDRLRETLGTEALEAAFDDRRSLTTDEAVRLALSALS